MQKAATYFGFVAVFLVGCYYDVEETLYPGFCNTDQVTYSEVIEPLVQLRCNAPACHAPGGDGIGDFTSYQGLKSQVDNGNVAQQVLEMESMPPAGALSSCEMDQVRIWIDNGAQQN